MVDICKYCKNNCKSKLPRCIAFVSTTLEGFRILNDNNRKIGTPRWNNWPKEKENTVENKEPDYSFNQKIIDALAAGESVWAKHILNSETDDWVEVDKKSCYSFCTIFDLKWQLEKPTNRLLKDCISQEQEKIESKELPPPNYAHPIPDLYLEEAGYPQKGNNTMPPQAIDNKYKAQETSSPDYSFSKKIQDALKAKKSVWIYDEAFNNWREIFGTYIFCDSEIVRIINRKWSLEKPKEIKKWKWIVNSKKHGLEMTRDLYADKKQAYVSLGMHYEIIEPYLPSEVIE